MGGVLPPRRTGRGVRPRPRQPLARFLRQGEAAALQRRLPARLTVEDFIAAAAGGRRKTRQRTWRPTSRRQNSRSSPRWFKNGQPLCRGGSLVDFLFRADSRSTTRRSIRRSHGIRRRLDPRGSPPAAAICNLTSYWSDQNHGTSGAGCGRPVIAAATILACSPAHWARFPAARCGHRAAKDAASRRRWRRSTGRNCAPDHRPPRPGRRSARQLRPDHHWRWRRCRPAGHQSRWSRRR